MSNLSPQSPMRPLSVGNVVSAGLRIYNSHLKTYTQLSLYAALWSLVPVYGWAKAAAISGLISRLAFGEVINRPERVDTAQSQVNSRLWTFLLSAILVGLIVFGTFLGLYISLIMVGVFSVGLIGVAFGQQSSVAIISSIVLFTVLFLLFLFALTWIYSRFMFAELPIAIEENVNASQSVNRSWELTKGFVLRIQAILGVAILITLPIYILTQVLAAVIQQSLANVLVRGSATYIVVSYIVGYVLGLIINIWILPFWQAIKAVIYYDLRSRREGLDLRLRDRF